MAKVLGKSHRKGISLIELADRFPNEGAAQGWFESIAWPNGEGTGRSPGFVDDHAAIYTDDATTYRGSGRKHEAVKHSAAEYVRYLEGETIHTTGVESF